MESIYTKIRLIGQCSLELVKEAQKTRMKNDDFF